MRAQRYGEMPDGTPVDLYSLGSGSGLCARIITYGGTLVGLDIPDRDGARANVVLDLPSLDAYREQDAYLCALVGRYANRIAGAAFRLDGVDYHLSRNDGDDCLHGGRAGFNKAVWQVVGAACTPNPRLTLRHESPDGDQGFPGAVTVEVTYSVLDGRRLRLDYAAETDRPTVINLTQHIYFNLDGAGSGDILGHEVTIAAECFTPTDAAQNPTGALASVAGTPFDFRTPQRIGARIGEPDPQLETARGYDHNFVLGETGRPAPRFAARAVGPGSGRALEVHTTEPGLQFYTGNHLDGSLRGPAGEVYGPRSAFCFESQHFPDSPNRANFPSTVLRPGERFISTTEYRFSTG